MHELRHQHASTFGSGLLWISLVAAIGCSDTTARSAGPSTSAGNGAFGNAGTLGGNAGQVARADGSTPIDMSLDASTPTEPESDASDSPDAGSITGVDGGKDIPSHPGYLHTDGSQIVDHDGNPVRLTGINWFGMETSNFAPHGLWARSLESMLDQIATLGYNMIRLPFCSQLFDPGSTPNGIDASKNPSLVGKSGLQLMDAIVEAAGARGLRVLLDRHRPDANAQSELWHTPAYSEARWIDDWKMLATRYKGNSTVIGFDLHNEPHGAATWGDGNASTDWRAAAERAGNAVLVINSDLLIVVEGVETYGGKGAWWGGNLRGAKDSPVRLSVANRLVYSPHEYPASVFAQSWFSAPDYPNNLPGVWREAWGYLAEDGIAPILIGEFGTKLQTDSDKQWLAKLMSYVGDEDLSFAYWCINPNSGDTGGILNDDWMSVNTAKQALIEPALAPLLP